MGDTTKQLSIAVKRGHSREEHLAGVAPPGCASSGTAGKCPTLSSAPQWQLSRTTSPPQAATPPFWHPLQQRAMRLTCCAYHNFSSSCIGFLSVGAQQLNVCFFGLGFQMKQSACQCHAATCMRSAAALCTPVTQPQDSMDANDVTSRVKK